jgi:uncharacterized protein (TIGR00730 family)
MEPSVTKMLTAEELREAANARISLITKEFTEGFNFLSNYPKSVTFFGSARLTEDNRYYKQARELGSRIAKELQYCVISGGGPGIMEAANRGAFEAGGQSLGLTIELPGEQMRNKYLTNYLDLYYFFSRKVCLSFSAEAYLFFPGGLGTLDEFFEILTLVQTKKIQRIPIILVGSDFWKSIHNLLVESLFASRMIDEVDTNLYQILDDNDKIIEIIKNAPIRNGIKFDPTHPVHKEIHDVLKSADVEITQS